MNNCCGLNLKGGSCPKPEVILLRQEAGICFLSCLHPCARALTLSVQVSTLEAVARTLLAGQRQAGKQVRTAHARQPHTFDGGISMSQAPTESPAWVTSTISKCAVPEVSVICMAWMPRRANNC